MQPTKQPKSIVDESSSTPIPALFENRGEQAIEQGNEIVIGFVGAAGVELKKAEEDFESRLKSVGYRVERINIASDIISKLPFAGNITNGSEHERLKRMMDLGNKAREKANDAGYLAEGIAASIKTLRPKGPTAAQGTAYLIHSLKHPEEVKRLRAIYPRGFYLVGVFASRDRRETYLIDERRMTQEQALEIMTRDMNEKSQWGQRLIDTFHLSDFFVRIEANDDRLKNSIWRIVDLLFSSPHKTPTFGEYAMFLAFAASLRSGDLSRQVGAVIGKEGEILATGANDCPKPLGGLYWPHYDENERDIVDDANGRDFIRGYDSNKKAQVEIIDEIVESVGGNKAAKGKLRKALEDSPIRDLTEFGRVVHAEMEALLSCARKGIPVKGATLYCTTFPCHNCAKHIIAAGISRVVFVEPYLKSKAFKLHDDALSMSYGADEDAASTPTNKVLFEPFVGVGPRRLFGLFSMNFGMGENLVRKNKDGTAKKWDTANASQRVKMVTYSYLDKESEAAAKFEATRVSWQSTP